MFTGFWLVLEWSWYISCMMQVYANCTNKKFHAHTCRILKNLGISRKDTAFSGFLWIPNFRPLHNRCNHVNIIYIYTHILHMSLRKVYTDHTFACCGISHTCHVYSFCAYNYKSVFQPQRCWQLVVVSSVSGSLWFGLDFFDNVCTTTAVPPRELRRVQRYASFNRPALVNTSGFLMSALFVSVSWS